MDELTDDQYQRLLAFRTGLRTFLRWSEDRAHEVGLTPAQHQLLLAVRGHPGGDPTVGDVAEYLQLRHHSAVGLVDRAEAAGLVARRPDPADHRVVRLSLTARGAELLTRLSTQNLAELRRLGPQLEGLWSGLPHRTPHERAPADRGEATGGDTAAGEADPGEAAGDDARG
jgi:DNA-binding MarR family transcriptional regulator